MICLYAERRPFSVSVTQGAALLRWVDEARPYSDSGGRAASSRRGRASRGRSQRPCGHRARSSDAPALPRSWGLWLSLTFIGHEGSGFTRAGLVPARRTHGRPVPEGPAEARARRTRMGGAGVLSRGPRATPIWATPTRAAPARLADPHAAFLHRPRSFTKRRPPAWPSACPRRTFAPSRGVSGQVLQQLLSPPPVHRSVRCEKRILSGLSLLLLGINPFSGNTSLLEHPVPILEIKASRDPHRWTRPDV